MRSTSTRRRGDGGSRLQLNEAQAKKQSQARAVEARTRLSDDEGGHEVGRGGAGGGRGRGRGATELGGRGGDGRGCGGGSHGPWARPGLGRRGALWPRWRRWRRRRGESPLGRGCATACRSRRRWLCGRRRQKKEFFLERGRKGVGRTSVRVFFICHVGPTLLFTINGFIPLVGLRGYTTSVRL